ncbi:hypothetical protein Hamer_G025892 [Homarus americanus]|uniref:CUB domain-containing protein n=1 Tax=Homarus americanus TaxID=6706 RepID=A0A8J5TLQ3_HOMAM|nr:hypothetical protein Hamer_G025892 [Homarus americanus]
MWMTRMWVWVWMWVSFHSSQAQQVSPTHARTDRFLSMFSVVRFKNNECQAVSGDTGICYHSASCSSGGGEPSGECAQGFGSCSKLGCGGSTENNGTYLESPNYPSDFNAAATCPYILHLTSDTCQAGRGGSRIGNYLRLRVTVWTTTPPSLKISIYLDVDPGVSIPLTLTFTTSTVSSGRRWKVKLSMITCDQLSLAPSGCAVLHHNYMGIKAGTTTVSICPTRTTLFVSGKTSTAVHDVPGQQRCNISFCDDTFEWLYNVNGLPAILHLHQYTCLHTSAPLTVSLQGPNYLYLVTTDSTNDHTDSTNINYSFTQNPC